MTGIVLNINDRDYPVSVENHELLIDVLRDRLHLYGTKKGCASGECGSCSVIVDGEVVNACLIFAVRAQGKRIRTIEGMEEADGTLHGLQQAFVDHAAVQCGFCGPGMLLASKVLLDRNPHPTEQEIREGLAGNVCRCSGYVNIIKAVQAYAGERGGDAHVQ